MSMHSDWNAAKKNARTAFDAQVHLMGKGGKVDIMAENAGLIAYPYKFKHGLGDVLDKLEKAKTAKDKEKYGSAAAKILAIYQAEIETGRNALKKVDESIVTDLLAARGGLSDEDRVLLAEWGLEMVEGSKADPLS